MLIDLISFAISFVISFVIISEFGEVVWQKTLGEALGFAQCWGQSPPSVYIRINC